jgi:hypothetical protein
MRQCRTKFVPFRIIYGSVHVTFRVDCVIKFPARD